MRGESVGAVSPIPLLLGVAKGDDPRAEETDAMGKARIG